MTTDAVLAAMDLTAVMAVAQIAQEDGVDQLSALAAFLQSSTAEKLYDDSLKLWWDGPAAVVEQYRAEGV